VAIAVSFVLVFASMIGGILFMVLRELRSQARWTEATRRVLSSGTSLPALVRSVGPSRRGRLVFSIALELQPEGAGEPLPRTVEALVPVYASSAIAPGEQVMVRYERASGAVAIDFVAMGYASPV
jgi:hypothetical protein